MTEKTNPHSVLKELVSLIVEQAARDALAGDGRVVRRGSRAHVADLESRIEQLEMFRRTHKRGTETRANYSRLISRLRAELAAARRAAARDRPASSQ